MARVAIANTSTYIQGCVDYYAYVSGSNIVVDVYFQMRRTNSYSGSTYGSQSTPQICISGDSTNFNYTGSPGITVYGGQQDVWQGIYSASRTFDASRSGNTIYVGWRVINDNSGYLGGSSVVAITLPTAYIAPNKPTNSIASKTTNQIGITYGTTSFGVPSSGTVYLYGGTASSPTTQIASKTTVGNSTFDYTNLTNNTKYFFRARANNGQLNSDYSTGISAVTLPASLTLSSAMATSDTTIEVSYTTDVGGTAYDKDIQYSLDNSTWVTGATVSSGAATSGAFTISGLTPSTTYVIYLRVSTASGDTTSGSVTATTMSAYKFYGSVNGQTKQITKLYGSINGQTKEIKKLYGSINGVTKRIF